MNLKRIRKLLAGFHIALHFKNDFLESSMLGLIGDPFKCGSKVNAGSDHHGQLTRKIKDILLGRLRVVEFTEGFHKRRASRLGL